MGSYFPVQAARLMRESAIDTALHTSDGGIIMTQPGTVSVDAFDSGQLGVIYNIKNASTGDVVVNAASGESFQEATGNVSTFTVPSNFSIALGRNATNNANWAIQ